MLFILSIYTRVSNYVNWINSKVKFNSFSSLPPAVTVVTTITTPALNVECKNLNDFVCNLYSKRYCGSMAYISGALFSNYCPKSCNTCGGNNKPSEYLASDLTTNQPCVDISSSCSSWKLYCNSLLSYTKHPCRKTCNLC